MSRMPDCSTCFDTAFYQGDPIVRTEEEMGPGKHVVYPSVICSCSAAKNWLEAHPHSDFKLGEWDGYCYNIHRTRYTWCPFTQGWVALDLGIIEDTLKLWNHGIQTDFSCEGGGGGNGTRYFKLSNVDDIPLAVTLLPWVGRVEDKDGRRAIYEAR